MSKVACCYLLSRAGHMIAVRRSATAAPREVLKPAAAANRTVFPAMYQRPLQHDEGETDWTQMPGLPSAPSSTLKMYELRCAGDSSRHAPWLRSHTTDCGSGARAAKTVGTM